MDIEPDAVELVQVACTEFICFVTSEAVESVQKQGRVAIKETDIQESLERLGFTQYLMALDCQLRVLRKRI